MTHPFLPQRGEEYRALERRRQQGVDIFIYREAPGQPQRHIPVAWTSLAEPDPWESTEVRSPFRLPDLLELAALLREMSCQRDSAAHVKKIPPGDQKDQTRKNPQSVLNLEFSRNEP